MENSYQQNFKETVYRNPDSLFIKTGKFLLSLRSEEEKRESFESTKKELIEFIEFLKREEAALWGSIKEIEEDEERIVEDANYLIYLISKEKEEEAKEYLKGKYFKEFLEDLKNLKVHLRSFKKHVHEKNRLKNLISNLTIKLVERDNYHQLEEIFILEKQLYEVLEEQEKSMKKLIKDSSKINFDLESSRVEAYLKVIKRIREILSGHLDHSKIWQEERMGYSNISNILHSLEERINNLEY